MTKVPVESCCALPRVCSRTSAGAPTRDYRGEQSMNIIAHGSFVAIDHPGRAYLVLSVYFRPRGAKRVLRGLRQLATTRMLDRARVLGAAMRVACFYSRDTSGVLPKTSMRGQARQVDP